MTEAQVCPRKNSPLGDRYAPKDSLRCSIAPGPAAHKRQLCQVVSISLVQCPWVVFLKRRAERVLRASVFSAPQAKCAVRVTCSMKAASGMV